MLKDLLTPLFKGAASAAWLEVAGWLDGCVRAQRLNTRTARRTATSCEVSGTRRARELSLMHTLACPPTAILRVCSIAKQSVVSVSSALSCGPCMLLMVGRPPRSRKRSSRKSRPSWTAWPRIRAIRTSITTRSRRWPASCRSVSVPVHTQQLHLTVHSLRRTSAAPSPPWSRTSRACCCRCSSACSRQRPASASGGLLRP
jgi:hypothetical protein